jgi:hypothetical protein
MMKAPPRTQKILITIPFWSRDRDQAMELARLLADLEPAHSEIADFAFVSRPDSKPADLETSAHVSRKFNLYNVVSSRNETGWPAGCNGTFAGTLDWTLRGIYNGQLPAYRGIFICESDACPLTRNPIGYIHGEWMKLKNKCVAGALIPPGPHGRAHVNGGCCVIDADPKFLSWLVTSVGGAIATGKAGWDWYLAEQFKMKGWQDLPGIKSHWQRPTFAEGEWDSVVNGGVKWLHGVKDYSLINLARQKLL